MPPKCDPDNCTRSTGSHAQVLSGLAERTEKGNYTAATLVKRKRGSRRAAKASPAFNWHDRTTRAYCELVKGMKVLGSVYPGDANAAQLRGSIKRARRHLVMTLRGLQRVVGEKTWRPIVHALGVYLDDDLSDGEVERAREFCARPDTENEPSDDEDSDEDEDEDEPDFIEEYVFPMEGPRPTQPPRRHMVVRERDAYSLRPRGARPAVPVSAAQAARLERQRARGARKFPVRTDQQREAVREQMRAVRDDGRPRMTRAQSLERARAARKRASKRK